MRFAEGGGGGSWPGAGATPVSFDICAAQAIDSSAAEKIYAMLSKIDEQPSFAELWPLLRREEAKTGGGGIQL